MSKTAYLKFKKGEGLTREEAMGAQCYECNGASLEMKDDCLGISCPLYQWSPWGASQRPKLVSMQRDSPNIQKYYNRGKKA